MKVVFIKPKLLEDYLKAIVKSNDTNVIDVSNIIAKIRLYINKMDDYELLIDNDISDGVFLALLNEIACFDFDDKDYMKILSNYNNINYNRILDIRTTMLEKRKVTTRRVYRSFVSDKENIKNNEILNKKELQEKIDNLSIVPISKRYLTNDVSRNEKTEKLEDFELTPYDAFICDDELSKYTKKYIRDNISIETLKKEYESYVKTLKYEIDHILNFNTIMNNSKNISNKLNEELKNNKYIKRL